MTLLLGMLLAFVLGCIVGALFYGACIQDAVKRGQWHRLPGFMDRKPTVPSPPAKPEDKTWN